MKSEKKVGLALGGGGARGLCHVPVVELLDEMGVNVQQVSGTSMGAIIGAMYAGGMSGKEIRKTIDSIRIGKYDTIEDVLEKGKDLLKWVDAVAADLGHGGVLKIDGFMRYLCDAIGKTTFEDLKIPLKAVASDYWNREEVVLESGDLIPALRASIAIPGVFAPVEIGDRVLVDGGLTNPLPYDLLMRDCDVVIAIDAMGSSSVGKKRIPRTHESILNAFYIPQQAIQDEKMRQDKPHIYVKPDIQDVAILEFHKTDAVYEQTVPAVKKLKLEIERVLG